MLAGGLQAVSDGPAVQQGEPLEDQACAQDRGAHRVRPGLIQDRTRHKPVGQKAVERAIDLLLQANRRCGMEFVVSVSFKVEGHMKVYSTESTAVKVRNINHTCKETVHANLCGLRPSGADTV
jgi:hypothetical protein